MRPRRLGSLLVCLVVGVSACASETITPDVVEPAGEPAGEIVYPTIVVGTIAAEHTEWLRLARLFKTALARRLAQSQAFETVLYPAPVTLPKDALVVTGTITEVDEGSELARMLIGAGVGSATLAGRFQLADAGGTALVRFGQTLQSSEGTKMDAHWDQLYIEDLTQAFARATADAVVRWSNGEPLQP